MNYPGVIYEDPEVMKKLEKAKKYGRIIDGHAPGVRGEELKKYVKAGILTDHECTDLEEAEEKIRAGMKILIREGSAAKNFEELMALIKTHPEEVMFCTDDSHPDDLAEGHINKLVRRSIQKGYDLWSVLQAAIVNPVKFYGMDAGLLQEGQPADMIVVEDLKEFKIKEVYIEGKKVFDGKKVKAGIAGKEVPNRFEAEKVEKEGLKIEDLEKRKIRVIVAKDGSLVTGEEIVEPARRGKEIVADTERDILKIVVMNRYKKKSKPVVGFIRGFGMKKGAIAGSIAHDSHNLVAVGVTDQDIAEAMNLVIERRGGIALVVDREKEVLPLPVAGLMSNEEGEKIAREYAGINRKAGETGTMLKAPFMTLSFMALLVIPELKIGDRGLFDVKKFKITDIFV